MAEDADLELVKGIFRAWERGDFSSVEWAHPDISYEVVVDQVFHGEGRSSGIPLDQIAGAAVLTVRDGKVVRFRGYTSLPDALADAGIKQDG